MSTFILMYFFVLLYFCSLFGLSIQTAKQNLEYVTQKMAELGTKEDTIYSIYYILSWLDYHNHNSFLTAKFQKKSMSSDLASNFKHFKNLQTLSQGKEFLLETALRGFSKHRNLGKGQSFPSQSCALQLPSGTVMLSFTVMFMDTVTTVSQSRAGQRSFIN